VRLTAARLNPKYFVDYKCGILVSFVGRRGVFSINLPCRQWGCEECREQVIVCHIKTISDLFNELKCVQVFVGYRDEKEKKLSNFINKNVSGHYCRINGQDKAVIISDRNFDGARRYDKRKFLECELPKILNQPWKEKRRISFSSGWKKPRKKQQPKYWAISFRNIRDEFNKLSTDKERKDWLCNKTNCRLTQLGEEFVKQDTTIKNTLDVFPKGKEKGRTN